MSTFNPLSKVLRTQGKVAVEKLWERRNACNKDFLLFNQCFLPFLKQISIFESSFFFVSKGFEFRQI